MSEPLNSAPIPLKVQPPFVEKTAQRPDSAAHPPPGTREHFESVLPIKTPEPDPLQLSMAASSAQLRGIHSRLGEILQQHLAAPNLQIDDVRDVEPELDKYLRFSREVHRFGNLELQIRIETHRHVDVMREYVNRLTREK